MIRSGLIRHVLSAVFLSSLGCSNDVGMKNQNADDSGMTDAVTDVADASFTPDRVVDAGQPLITPSPRFALDDGICKLWTKLPFGGHFVAPVPTPDGILLGSYAPDLIQRFADGRWTVILEWDEPPRTGVASGFFDLASGPYVTAALHAPDSVVVFHSGISSRFVLNDVYDVHVTGETVFASNGTIHRLDIGKDSEFRSLGIKGNRISGSEGNLYVTTSRGLQHFDGTHWNEIPVGPTPTVTYSAAPSGNDVFAANDRTFYRKSGDHLTPIKTGLCCDSEEPLGYRGPWGAANRVLVIAQCPVGVPIRREESFWEWKGNEWKAVPAIPEGAEVYGSEDGNFYFSSANKFGRVLSDGTVEHWDPTEQPALAKAPSNYLAGPYVTLAGPSREKLFAGSGDGIYRLSAQDEWTRIPGSEGLNVSELAWENETLIFQAGTQFGTLPEEGGTVSFIPLPPALSGGVGTDTQLGMLSIRSKNDVVGVRSSGIGHEPQSNDPLFYRWNGSEWSSLPVGACPPPGLGKLSVPSSVVLLGQGRVLASCPQSSYDGAAYLFDGTTWSTARHAGGTAALLGWLGTSSAPSAFVAQFDSFGFAYQSIELRDAEGLSSRPPSDLPVGFSPSVIGGLDKENLVGAAPNAIGVVNGNCGWEATKSRVLTKLDARYAVWTDGSYAAFRTDRSVTLCNLQTFHGCHH